MDFAFTTDSFYTNCQGHKIRIIQGPPITKSPYLRHKPPWKLKYNGTINRYTYL